MEIDQDPVSIRRNLVYGEGVVGASGPAPRARPLTLDLYAPAGPTPPGGRPAFVFAHGGAYHRGSKEDDSFEGDGGRNTSAAEYCRRFAARGWIAASVGYRLTTEEPAAGGGGLIAAPGAVSRARIDVVRAMMGLAPASSEVLAAGMEAAARDMAAAIRFIASGGFGTDPARIVGAGFSAGGCSALYAVFGLGAPAAAVIALSARLEAADIERLVTERSRRPVLHVVAERDLDHVRSLTDALQRRYAESGAPHQIWQAPGYGHFYPRDAAAEGPDGARSTVEDAILGFLSANGLSP